MSNDRYVSVNVEKCARESHRLITAWSDKTPMKVNLICETCSLKTGKSAYAAYGDDTKSFGQWRSQRRRQEAAATEPEYGL